MENPFELFSLKEEEKKEGPVKEIIHNILAILGKNIDSDSTFIAWLSSWLSNIKGLEERKGFSGLRLCEAITEIFQSDNERKNELEYQCIELLATIKDICDISNYKVPIIKYKGGDQRELYEIFVKINQGGKRLSNYQLCAALWADDNYDLKIINGNVEAKIREKYKNMKAKGFKMEDIDSDDDTSKYNIFEYIYGLGKVIEEKYPTLFTSGSNKPDYTNSASFKCIAISFLEDHDITKMDKLPEKLSPLLKKCGQSAFESAIIDSMNILETILSPYTSLNANQSGKKKKFEKYHNDYQLVSLVGKIIQTKYDSSLIQRKDWENNRTRNPLMQRLPFHFLRDVIEDKWQGHGNVTAQKYLSEDPEFDYDRDIGFSDWENTLNKWTLMDLRETSKNRVMVKGRKMLFLRFIYSNTITTVENQNVEYELEHLVPVSRLKKTIKEEKLPGIQINSLGNIVLIPKTLNRDKKDLTIYEYYDDLRDKGVLTEHQSQELISGTERFSFTTRDDLEFVGDHISKDDYIDFLEKRIIKIKRKFYEKNGISMDGDSPGKVSLGRRISINDNPQLGG